MPRPISWLPRLHEIRRSVAGSVRSHYDRSDLERLFEVQPRSAQRLLEVLPTLPVGTSRLVEREALVAFLEGVQQADDVTAYIEAVRIARFTRSQRKIRWLVRADQAPATVASLPEGMRLDRGRLEVDFRSAEHLAESLMTLARIMDADPEAFRETFEPQRPATQDRGGDGVREMFEELEAMEAAR